MCSVFGSLDLLCVSQARNLGVIVWMTISDLKSTLVQLCVMCFSIWSWFGLLKSTSSPERILKEPCICLICWEWIIVIYFILYLISHQSIVHTLYKMLQHNYCQAGAAVNTLSYISSFSRASCCVQDCVYNCVCLL